MLFLQLLISPARAEVVKESYLIIGHHKKETVSLREHKVKTGTGYSVVKTFSDGTMKAHTLNAKNYSVFASEIEKLLKYSVKQSRDIAGCADPVVLGHKIKDNEADLKIVCMEQEPVSKRKDFVRWWRKTSKYL